MEGLPILNIIGGIAMYIAKLVILIAAIIAVYKKKNTASILLLLGILSIILGDLIGMVLLMNAGMAGADKVVRITGIDSIISGLTYLFFSVGVLVFILQVVRQEVRGLERR